MDLARYNGWFVFGRYQRAGLSESLQQNEAVKEGSGNPLFAAGANGRPTIANTPATVYGYGQLIRGTERMLLDLFSRGLLSGTTHTCLGQEICQMSVVRALDHPGDAVLSNHRSHRHFLTYSGLFQGL